MTQRNYTIDDVELLISKGRLARSRAFAATIAGSAHAAGDAVRTAVAALARHAEQARAVRELREMDARMLADIGLTPADVELAASGKLAQRADDRPAFRPANESVAPALRASPRAA